jgi:probable rRNA maturation factor
VPDDDPSPSETSFDIELRLAHPAWQHALPDASAHARRAVRAALHAERKRLPRASAVAVSVVLGDDALVRALNATHRGKDKPTNVLSFPMPEHFSTPAAEQPLGDIVLAYETVAAEAEAGRISLADHTTHLLVHGTLHLLGFTHEEDDTAGRMEAEEAKILHALGVSRPVAELEA